MVVRVEMQRIDLCCIDNVELRRGFSRPEFAKVTVSADIGWWSVETVGRVAWPIVPTNGRPFGLESGDPGAVGANCERIVRTRGNQTHDERLPSWNHLESRRCA
jgi:hypothetical protein